MGYSIFTTLHGVGGAVSSETGLVEIILPFTGLNLPDREKKSLDVILVAGENLWYSVKAAEELQNYFAGNPAEFPVPLDLGRANDFGLL